MVGTVSVGEIYGGLQVVSIERNPKYKTGSSFKVLVKCMHCGSVVYRDRSNVKSFTLKSCGCRRNVITVERKSKYGD